MVSRIVKSLGLALALAAVVLVALPTGSYAAALAPTRNLPNGSLPAAQATLSQQDIAFMQFAAQANLAEITMGQWALNRSHNSEVRAFAQQMITDHTAQLQQLQALAARKGVTLPTTLDPMHQQLLAMLSAVTDYYFDIAYMGVQVMDHRLTLARFEREAASGSDPDVKAFAAAAIPVLRMHLEEAIRIYNSLLYSRP